MAMKDSFRRAVFCFAAIAILFIAGLGSGGAEARTTTSFRGKLAGTLPGHAGYVNSLSISPDGKTIASASLDGVKIWDVAKRKLVRSFMGHAGGVHAVQFSNDGRFLATGGCENYNDNDGCLYGGWKLWDVRDYSEVRGVTDLPLGVHRLAFSPSGEMLATAVLTAKDPTIKLWDVSTGERLNTLQPPIKMQTACVLFAPDGSRLITATHNILSIWDPPTGQNIRNFQAHEYRLSSIAASRDGRFFATGTGVDNEIKVWNGEFKDLMTLKGHKDDVIALSFSPDSKLLASGSYDKTLKIWDLASGRRIKSMIAHRYIVKCMSFSPVENLLVSGGCERQVQGDCKQGLIKIWK